MLACCHFVPLARSLPHLSLDSRQLCFTSNEISTDMCAHPWPRLAAGTLSMYNCPMGRSNGHEYKDPLVSSELYSRLLEALAAN